MNNQQVAQKVVDRIVELINKGEPLPWVKPWSTGTDTVIVKDGVRIVTEHVHCWNRRGTPYKGVNRYLPEGEYITFNQCKAEGGRVKKGAHSWPVVYWNFKEVEETDATTGETTTKRIPMLFGYQVFNLKDCEGIEQKHHPEPIVHEIPIVHLEPVKPDDTKPLDQTAEDIIADYVKRAGNGFHIIRDTISNRAFYSPALDYVQVPCRGQFESMSEYYSTMFHELGHSTGHETRLNRLEKDKVAGFGTQSYSREELVAEATAATILSMLGMNDGNTFRNSAAYIKGWSTSIKKDPMMYITAATKAQAAVDLILGTEA